MRQRECPTTPVGRSEVRVCTGFGALLNVKHPCKEEVWAFSPAGPLCKQAQARWSWQDGDISAFGLINWNVWTLLKKVLLLCTDAAPAFRVGEQVCASHPSDTIYPKTQKASAPKTHASRLPIAHVSSRLTLQVHCDYALITMPPCPPHPPPRVYAYALWAVMGYYWDVWRAHLSDAYRLFPTQFPMDVFVVPWKEDGQDIRDFFSPGRSLVSTASERSMCRW